MRSNNSTELLRTLSIRVTKARQVMVNVMLNHLSSFSVKDLYDKVSENYGIDLVTVYRFVHLLRDRDALKVVADIDGSQYYCFQEHKNDHHHLVCNVCHRITCFRNSMNLRLDSIEADSGFAITQVSVLFKGVCSHCSQ